MVARCGSRWGRRRRGGIRPWWRRCPAPPRRSGEIRRRHGRSGCFPFGGDPNKRIISYTANFKITSLFVNYAHK